MTKDKKPKWSAFEIILIVIGPLSVLVTGLVFGSNALTMISSILTIFAVMLVAKGLIVGNIIGLFSSVLYAIVSYLNGFYGEMIINFALTLPMYIWAIIEWSRNKNEKTNTVEIGHMKVKEYILIFLAIIPVFIGFYFLLQALGTNQLVLSTLSLIDDVFAVFLIARRCKVGFVLYCIDDIVLIALWGLPVLGGNLALFAMLVNPIMSLVVDIYGVVNWHRLQKKQTEIKSNS